MHPHSNEPTSIDRNIHTVRKHPSSFQLACKRFLKNKLAIIGSIILLIIILMAVFAPFITDHDPTKADLLIVDRPPSSEHILGTDASGRDTFARLLYGARVSLTIGVSAMLFKIGRAHV